MTRRTRIQGCLAAATALGLWISIAPAAQAAFPGPSGRIFFGAAGDVWSVAPDGTGLLNLTDRPAGPGSGHDPSVSVGGTVAFVVGEGPAAEIWTMAADGSAARPVTDDSFADRMPAISPDGRRIAFSTDRGAPTAADIWTIAADGSGAGPLLAGAGDDLDPQFAADGLHLVLASRAAGNLDIAYVPATGGPHASATPITTRSTLDESTPAIQPDMVRLAYTQADPAVPGPSDIFTAYSNDGTDEFALAVDPGRGEHSPAFSPDGTEVAYATEAGLIVAAAGGAAPRPLDTGPATGPEDPDWAVGAAVDRRAPQTRITRAPNRRTQNRRPRLRFRASEPGSTFECRLDRTRFRPCGSPKRLRRLAPGRHLFEVRATDPAGNVDPSPDRARFRVTER